jgi:maltose alpha-D-glucosyltransferase/alpha-amylase
MLEEDKGYVGREEGLLWYKDAIIYELHVRAYHDSDGDGKGDFKGLTEKLDYLQDLGVTAIWLLPFYPSPLRDDGYDISDYTAVHNTYGTMGDFRAFLRAAHRRGLRVITELVLNHTSDQHAWFQRARRAKAGSVWRNYYVWSESPERYRDARIIFKDFETSNWAWDPLAKAYYWHRFYSHQPDLNYDEPYVRKAMFRAINFWLGLGVDGLRLDAVPYLYEREGTNCENLPETFEFLQALRAAVDSRFKDRMLLAEANQWPEDAVIYFGNGDRCHMAFHFPLMPRLFMALRMEDRFPVIDILEQTPEIPESCQWALFLRNHDELTLEMVTDEERDYMYRVYAHDIQMRINLGIRRRLAPLLGNHRRRIELMNGLLFSLPGTPVIYYGDEIGMGDNNYLGDRNGVRTPMHWSADRNAGFSRANPQSLYLPVITDPEYHYESINVETMRKNPHSLLWWMKRLIAMRRRFAALGRGTLEFLHPENRKILAFVRRCGDESILVVANLSRFVQYAELDLLAFKGMVPVEVFGRTPFPPIGELPYFLTLGPHSFYWFTLELQRAPQESLQRATLVSQLPTLTTSDGWEAVLKGQAKGNLEKVLPDYLQCCRWFGGKARRIKSVRIVEIIPVKNKSLVAYLTFLQVEYVEGDPETYILPLACVAGKKAEALTREHPQAAIARVHLDDKTEEGILCDAFLEEEFCETLLEIMARRRRPKGGKGELLAKVNPVFREIRRPQQALLDTSILQAEQSNTSVVFGDQFILKLFRRLQDGINPDLEIGQFLTKRGFAHVPPVAGAIEYRKGKEEPATIAILQGFVSNVGDAWEYTLDVVKHFFEVAVSQRETMKAFSMPREPLVDLIDVEPPPLVHNMIGPYHEAARLLGQRTAELHVALASDTNDPRFAPEPFSKLYQRSLYQTMRSLTRQVFQVLRQRVNEIPGSLPPDAERMLGLEYEILNRFRPILEKKITALRTRCHGDFHLGQVLHTGKDFVIIDFEGEPARPIGERRIKRSPLRDIAGMLRSFHYAAYASIISEGNADLISHEDLTFLGNMAGFWHLWVGAVFLKAYKEVAASAEFLPQTKEEFRLLLDIYLLEKAVYELGYELNNRPRWVKIPLKGVFQLLEAGNEH